MLSDLILTLRSTATVGTHAAELLGQRVGEERIQEGEFINSRGWMTDQMHTEKQSVDLCSSGEAEDHKLTSLKASLKGHPEAAEETNYNGVGAGLRCGRGGRGRLSELF